MLEMKNKTHERKAVSGQSGAGKGGKRRRNYGRGKGSATKEKRLRHPCHWQIGKEIYHNTTEEEI